MAKRVLGDFPLPEEGDIIDQISAAESERITRTKAGSPKRSGAVEELKRRVDLVALFESFGVALKPRGKQHEGICPWHPDQKSPSLSVDRVKGLYHCFGCQESGDAITLVEKMKAYSFSEALAYLKKMSNLSGFTANSGFVAAHATSKQPPAQPVPNPTQSESIAQPELGLKAVAEYYQKKLLSSPEALAYLEKRGFRERELYSRFAVGYADGSLLAKTSERERAELKALGIVSAKGYEHFKGCISFPLYDATGLIVGMYGRSIQEAASYKHLYLPGGHQGLFNAKAAKVYEEVILTEAIIDALALISLGIENVIPLYGTSGFTENHLIALKTNRVKTVTIALDNDEAGTKAAAKLKDELLALGFNVKICVPQGVKDWSEGLASGFTRETVLSALAASEVFNQPTNKTDAFQVEKHKGLYNFNFGETHYRILGVKDCFVASLKVNIHFRYHEKSHVDNPELYSSRSRSAFALEAKRKSEVEESRVEKELLAIVEYLETERDKLLGAEVPVYELTEGERKLGLEFLTNPRLFELIVEHMETLGYVGEELNKILVYLAASSRKLDDPISIVILSESAAGKSYLIDTVKKLLPEEDVISLTSLSDQALNYLPDEGLLHKFLVMGEAVHNEIVEHQLREMLSSKELSRLVTVKDERTGKMQSKLVRKEVIVSTVMSSTDYGINPENLSRCFLINTDESSEQTKRIHQKQREKYSIERHKVKGETIPAIIRTHQAAQRLLKKRIIVNPLSKRLDFPTGLIRARRDHERFMDLIATVCFLRQYQKPELSTAEGLTYLACDKEDYRIASRIMKAILPLTLTNFPKSALTLFEVFRRLVQEKAKAEGLEPLEVSLTQRELRELGGLSQMFVKRGLHLLCEYEYLREAGSSRNGVKKSYKLYRDLPIQLVDLSQIVEPEALEALESAEELELY